jgi:CIC family chloride channel protein
MEEKEDRRKWPLGLPGLSLLAVLVGIIAGLGAVAFRGLIGFFHNLLFLGKLSVFYDANIHTPPGPWGPGIILVPVLGAAGVAFLVKNFAPEAKGTGVPEVMEAVYYKRGVIRPLVAAIKALASSLSLGSGGSVGREGPIIQIGSSFGSLLGQVLPMRAWQRITLVAAGAGGGIAATFNTPAGGVLFAMEIIMYEVSVRTLVPVLIATASATYVSHIFFGSHLSFVVPDLERFSLPEAIAPLALLAYAGLGGGLGLACGLFIKSVYAFEDFFERKVGGGYYVRHMLGMFLVGLMMYFSLLAFGHYYIEGVGYATIQDLLSGSRFPLLLLLLLPLLKLLVTSLSLGSGASGGIFSPSLYLGGTLGGLYAVGLVQLLPGLEITPAAFALAGMAGMVGGATGAAMAAIVMIFEMTLSYPLILPMTITVAITYGVRKMLISESIYTLKLVRRGRYMAQALQANFHDLHHAGNIMDTQFITAPVSAPLDVEWVRRIADKAHVLCYSVETPNRVIGVVTRDAALRALGLPGRKVTLGELAVKNYVVVTEEMRLFEVIDHMLSQKAPIALVSSRQGKISVGDVKGLIHQEQISEAMMETVRLFSD